MKRILRLVTLCCLLLAYIKSASSTSPQFTIQPSDAVVTFGHTLSLACQATGIPEPTITWWQGNDQLVLAGRYSRLANNSLQITDFSGIDEGVYACVAGNADGSVRSANASVSLAFLQAPTDTSSQTVCYRQYEYQELTCEVPNSNPEPVVTWYRGSDLVVASGRRGISLLHKLVFSYLDSSDVSQWRCKVSNGSITYDSSSYVVANLHACPSEPTLSPVQSVAIEINPKSLTADEGATVEFECFARGHPLPTYSWEKNGNSLQSSERISFSQNSKIVRIQNVVLADGGTYTCTATQSLSMSTLTSSSPAILTVIEVPRIVNSFGATTQNASLSVSLMCTATGTPPITWVWRKNSILIQPSNQITISSTSSFSTITITDLRVNDGGVFQCVARNSAGTGQANELLSISTSQPIFTAEPSDTIVLDNSVLVLPCRGIGFPFPTVKWMKSDQDLLLDSTHMLASNGSDGTLTISPVTMSDAGTYKCMLSNVIGNISQVAIVKVISPPTVITSPSDVLVTIGQTITMSCSAMLGTPVIINYRWTKDNDIVGTSDQRVTLTNGNLSIENFMETDRGKYECIAELSISGINSPPVLWSVGSGFYTEVEPHPPGAPQGPTVATQTQDQVVLSWTAPTDTGGLNLLDYIVNIVTLGRPDCIFNSEINYTVSAESTQAQSVGPLASYSRHQARVFARNSKGVSMSSVVSPIFWTEQAAPLGAPQMLSAIQGDGVGQLNISWQPIDCETANGEVTQYIIEYRTQGSLYPPFVTSTSFLYRTLTGLQVLTDYEVNVTAQTGGGRGQLSATVTAYTSLASKPRPPRSLTGQVNSTTVTLTWLPPLPVDGEPVINQTIASRYIVSYSGNEQGTLLTTTSYVVNNLTAGVVYNFSVAASNAFGVGEPATVNASIPLPSSPTSLPIYEEVWFIPVVAGGGAILVFSALLVPLLLCCLCCRRKWHSADVRSIGRSSATYGRPGSYINTTLQVETHSSSSSSSSSGSATSGSRTPTPLYHEPADTLGHSHPPVLVRSRGTLPSQNGTLRSKYMYRSPLERAEDELLGMVETSETANRGTRTIMPLELELRTRNRNDSLPDIPDTTRKGTDSPDYQWSPPAGNPLPYQKNMQHDDRNGTWIHDNEEGVNHVNRVQDESVPHNIITRHQQYSEHSHNDSRHHHDSLHSHNDTRRHHDSSHGHNNTRHRHDSSHGHNDTRHRHDSVHDHNDTRHRHDSSHGHNDTRHRHDSSHGHNDTRHRHDSTHDHNDTRHRHDSSHGHNDTRHHHSSHGHNDTRRRHDSSHGHNDTRHHHDSSHSHNDTRHHHDSAHRSKDSTFHQNTDPHFSDVKRHHSDAARHKNDIHNEITRHHSARDHHQSDFKLRSREEASGISSDMPRPSSPPHDHLDPPTFKTDYPKSSPTKAPPFKHPPAVRKKGRDSPTASVTSFEYQCLSPFQLNKKSQSQKGREQHSHNMRLSSHSHSHADSSANSIHSNSARPFSYTGVVTGAQRKLAFTPPTRQTPNTSQYRQNLPDITQTAMQSSDHQPDDQQRVHANIHRQPTKRAEEEEKRITMEKIYRRRQAQQTASAARGLPQFDDANATFV